MAFTACALTGPAHAQNLFVANNSDSTIEKFNSAGVGTQFNASSDLSRPFDMALASAAAAAVPESSAGVLLPLGLVMSRRKARWDA